MTSTVSESQVRTLRRFNRNYIRRLGLVPDRMYGTSYTLSDSHVLFQLSFRPHELASLAAELNSPLDVVDELIRGLEERGQVSRMEDGVRWQLSDSGARTSQKLCELSAAKVNTLLVDIPDQTARERLVAAIAIIESLVLPTGVQKISQTSGCASPQDAVPSGKVMIRSMKGGDCSWLSVMFSEYTENIFGVEARIFESYLCTDFAKFLRNYDEEWERMFVAVRQVPVNKWNLSAGMKEERVGGVYCSRFDDKTARLAMMYVDDCVRGTGVGRRLMSSVLNFARSKGYSKIRLVTHEKFELARKMYKATGFSVIERKEKYMDWGFETALEWWEMDL